MRDETEIYLSPTTRLKRVGRLLKSTKLSNENIELHSYVNLRICLICTVSMAARRIVQKLGNRVKEVAKNKSSSWWYTPHMAAASRAIAERIPLVDLVLEIRDARVRPYKTTPGDELGLFSL